MTRWAACLLVVHASLLAWLAYRYSPTIDELGHLPAGVSIWKFGRFDLYRVNPPLVKGIAALPAMAAGIEQDWSSFGDTSLHRPEWAIGCDFIRANGVRSFWYWTLARWACIPLSLVGGFVCYRWSADLFGEKAALVALTCWCFSPSILAYGALILPDLGATSLGLLAAWTFRNWLIQANWSSATWAGVALGLAELTKLTWIILFAIYPLIWGFCVFFRGPLGAVEWKRQGAQLAAVLGIGLYVLNAGYAFDGSFNRLGSFTFHSSMLTGNDTSGISGNRSWGTPLEHIPVPLPRDYLTGIDLQKVDFEKGKWSYLRGEHRFGGWWYFYLYALAIKEPLAIWLLFIASIVAGMFGRLPAIPIRDATCLAVIPLAVLTIVSFETGFTRYMRYVLPVLPFIYFWGSRVVVSRHRWGKFLAVAACLWLVAGSLWCFPHSFSYCNELAGGPRHGMSHLFSGNFDYGQNVLFLRDWIVEHPDARPLYLQVNAYCDLRSMGLDFPSPERCKEGEEVPSGWYAISASEFQSPQTRYSCFADRAPSEVVANTIFIYHVE